MPSPRAQEDADMRLRRLRNDVNAFQSPDVRRALLSANSTRREPIQRTIPVLEAELIEIRTSLTEATEKISKLERSISTTQHELEEERARTLSLETALKVAEHERDTFTTRVGELERDHLNVTKSASENAALLSMSSMSTGQRVAQLESDLEHARAARIRIEAEFDTAKTNHDSETREFVHQKNKFEEDIIAMSDRIIVLEASNAQLLEERKRFTAEAEANISIVSSRAEASAAEVAELRAECANRAQEARIARADCAAKLMEVRKVRAEVGKKEKELESISKMQDKVRRLEKEVTRGRNATELVDALQEEKTMLKGLIGSLASSGLPADGLKILRDTTLKKALQEHSSSRDVSAVSLKELEEISSRMLQYGRDVEEARRQAREAKFSQDAAVMESERNKRLREKAEYELETLRQTVPTKGSSLHSGKSVQAQTNEYKKIIEELETVVREKEEELIKIADTVTPSEVLQRDLIRLLDSQLRATERELEANGSKTSIVSRLGVKDGRVGKCGGTRQGRGNS